MKHLRRDSKMAGRETELIALYKGGACTYELAEHFGLDPSCIWRALKTLGVKTRGASEALAASFRSGRSTAARGQNNPAWRGGRAKHSAGYVLRLVPGHPRANVNGYVKESIIVVEDCLERKLLPSEIVHHINGIRDDNRPENLAVMPEKHHREFHAFAVGGKIGINKGRA